LRRVIALALAIVSLDALSSGNGESATPTAPFLLPTSALLLGGCTLFGSAGVAPTFAVLSPVSFPVRVL
jgi:hypothetical protein